MSNWSEQDEYILWSLVKQLFLLLAFFLSSSLSFLSHKSTVKSAPSCASLLRHRKNELCVRTADTSVAGCYFYSEWRRKRRERRRKRGNSLMLVVSTDAEASAAPSNICCTREKRRQVRSCAYWLEDAWGTPRRFHERHKDTRKEYLALKVPWTISPQLSQVPLRPWKCVYFSFLLLFQHKEMQDNNRQKRRKRKMTQCVSCRLVLYGVKLCLSLRFSLINELFTSFSLNHLHFFISPKYSAERKRDVYVVCVSLVTSMDTWWGKKEARSKVSHIGAFFFFFFSAHVARRQ